MISPALTALLKNTKTYYKCKNKTRVIQKRINHLKNKNT